MYGYRWQKNGKPRLVITTAGAKIEPNYINRERLSACGPALYSWAEPVLAIIDLPSAPVCTASHPVGGARPAYGTTGAITRRVARSLALATLVMVAPATLAQTTPPTPPASAGPADADVTLPWLSRLLESMKPSVDTSLPESSRAATARLEKALDDGKAEQSLPEIEQRLAASSEQNRGGGEDVQMLFLKARALNQLGKRQQAKDVYRDMTQRFPELPEPWNNLAALEVADGRLEQAKMALDMAIRNDPSYAVAHENQGDLFMMLAARSYNDALKLAPQNTAARNKENGIKSLLEAKTPPSTSTRKR